MNEIICSITSAIEEGRSWGHTDKEIADYIYAKHIGPWRRSSPKLRNRGPRFWKASC